jgi:hypothetical protein
MRDPRSTYVPGGSESVFHHFWYDAAVVSATFLTTARRDAPMQIGFPTLRF